MGYCTRHGILCEYVNRYGHCVITACTKYNGIMNTNNRSFLDTRLVYNKTIEEETEEKRKVSLAENYLENLGIKVKTDMYGYYRNTYDILKDLGEYLSKNDKY